MATEHNRSVGLSMTMLDKCFLEGELCDNTISGKQWQSIRGQRLPKLEDSECTMSYKEENKSHFEDNFITLDT